MIDIPTVAPAEAPESGIIAEYIEEMPDIFIVTVDLATVKALKRPPSLDSDPASALAELPY